MRRPDNVPNKLPNVFAGHRSKPGFPQQQPKPSWRWSLCHTDRRGMNSNSAKKSIRNNPPSVAMAIARLHLRTSVHFCRAEQICFFTMTKLPNWSRCDEEQNRSPTELSKCSFEGMKLPKQSSMTRPPTILHSYGDKIVDFLWCSERNCWPIL